MWVLVHAGRMSRSREREGRGGEGRGLGRALCRQAGYIRLEVALDSLQQPEGDNVNFFFFFLQSCPLFKDQLP